MAIPADLRYAESHEWVRDNGDGTVTVGITDHAQDQLGEVVFVEIQALGQTIGAGDPVGVVESVKSVNDVYSPIAGEVTEINEGLGDKPEFVNEDPYGEGWMFKLKLADAGDLAGLLDAAAYAKLAG